MKTLIKYTGYSLFALFLLVVVLLAAVPFAAKTVAQQQYAQRVAQGELSIDKLTVNYFKGEVRLRGVVARQAKQEVLRLGRLSVDMDISQLWHRAVVVESLDLQDFSIAIEQTPQHLVAAGYAVDTNASPKPAPTPADNSAPQQRWIDDVRIERVTLSNASAQIVSPALSGRATIQHLQLSGFDSARPGAETEVDLRLGLDGMTLNQQGRALELAAGGELTVRGHLRQLLSKPALIADIGLNNLAAQLTSPEANGRATLKHLQISGLNTAQPDQQAEVDMRLGLDGIRLNLQGRALDVATGGELTVRGHLRQWLTEPALTADIRLTDLAVQASEIDTQLLSLKALDLQAVNYQAAGVELAQATAQQLQLIKPGQGEPALLAVDSLHLEQMSLPELQAVKLETLTLAGLYADILLDPQSRLMKLQTVLDYLAPPPAATAPEVEPPAETKQTAQTEPYLYLGQLLVESGSQVHLVAQAVTPVFERTLGISQLSVKNIDTRDPQAATDMVLQADISEYSHIDLQGQLQVLAQAPSGHLRGIIKGVELVPLSPYAKQASGYVIRSGSAQAKLDVTLHEARLGGKAGVLLSGIKLAPGDKKKMDRLKQSIAMPLDTALALLRDKHGDVNLTLPMEGNIKDPDFDIANVLGQVSRKVLQKATVMGLKYAIQPYGAMLTVGSWLGKKITAVRLDALHYEPGVTALTAGQQDYLGKVAKIMQEKPVIRIKLCPLATPAEQQALYQQALAADPQAAEPDQAALLALAELRVAQARQYLIEQQQVDADRLLLCQPWFNADAKQEKSLLYLEI